MTRLTLHRSAHAATATVGMAVFAAVFFGLPAAGLAAVAVFSLLILAGTLAVARSARRGVTAAAQARGGRRVP